MRDPRLLQTATGGRRRQEFDRLSCARAHGRDWDAATSNGRSGEVNRARAALSDAAAKLRSGQLERIAQHPEQRRVGIDVDRVRPAVHIERVMWHTPLSANGITLLIRPR